MNDASKEVKLVLDASLVAEGAIVALHPLTNTRTVSISGAELLKFVTHFGHEPMLLDFGAVVAQV
jgi:hypothetical protein